MKMQRFRVGDRVLCVKAPAFQLSVFEPGTNDNNRHITGELTPGWVYEIKGTYMPSEGVQYVVVVDDIGQLIDCRADHFDSIAHADGLQKIDAA